MRTMQFVVTPLVAERTNQQLQNNVNVLTGLPKWRSIYMSIP